MKGKPKDVNMKPGGLTNTRASTGFAQKSPKLMLQLQDRDGKWSLQKLICWEDGRGSRPELMTQATKSL